MFLASPRLGLLTNDFGWRPRFVGFAFFGRGMQSIDDLIEQVWRSLRAGDGVRLAIGDIGQEIFDAGEVSDEVFCFLVDAMGSRELIESADCLYFFKIIEENIDIFSESQKAIIFGSIKSSLGNIADDVAAFLGVEVIVELGSGRNSLEFLIDLDRRGDSRLRSIVVHGLDWLAKKTVDMILRSEVISLLKEMCGRSDPAVVREAMLAVSRRGGG